MTSQLEKIPNELFENIAVFLGLQDICSLRLASRSIVTKATQDHFKTFFKTKSASLTERSLRSLAQATQANGLGRFIEELTLVGIANNVRGLESLLRKKTRTVTERNGPMFVSTEETCGDEELAKAQDDLYTLRQRQRNHEECLESGRYVQLLAEVFGNLLENSNSGTLRKLTLEVAVYRQDAQRRVLPMSGGGWRYIWRSTAETYQIAMSALAKSKLPIKDLQIFSEPNMRRCSVACDEINKVDFDELQTSLATVRSLRISLSHRIIFETDHDEERTGDPGDEIDWAAEPEQREAHELRAEAQDENNFIGLANLVAICHKVEDLEIHSYSLGLRALSISDQHHERLLQRLVARTTGSLGNLRTLRLRNLYMIEADVLTLVTHAPLLRDFMLENVFMIEGTYRALFDHCTSEQANMRNLLFDDLWEQKHLYFAEPGGVPKFPSSGGVTGTNMLIREGEEEVRRRTIEYHFSDWPPLRSAQQNNWSERRRAEYGPPG